MEFEFGPWATKVGQSLKVGYAPRGLFVGFLLCGVLLFFLSVVFRLFLVFVLVFSATAMVTLRSTVGLTWVHSTGSASEEDCGCDMGYRAVDGHCEECGEGLDCKGMDDVHFHVV